MTIAMYPGFIFSDFISTYGPVSGTISSSVIPGSPITWTAQSIVDSGQDRNLIGTVQDQSIDGTIWYSFSSAIADIIQTNVSSDVSLDYSHGNLSWVISNAAGDSIAMSWSQGAMTMFGLTSSHFTIQDATQTAIGVVPWFVWVPTIQEFGIPLGGPYQGLYENDQSFKSRWSVDATRKYSVGRLNTSTYKNWSWQGEPRSNVFSMYTGSFGNESPWTTGPTYLGPHYTWQQLKTDVRSTHPFMVMTASNILFATNAFITEVYQFRDEGALFKPTMQQNGWDQSWNLEVLANVVSRSI